LAKEVIAWATKRNRRKITISWQFSKNNAREKLKRAYQSAKN